ncbi:helix-turn-helix domain-containing protein [Streptomyces coffeae]|uniref:Helix-turn-helix domain-containing protein n=1 Tax=Streptomyces coffeae TaxID=621382 RepID=A0ABS1NJA7_9ACTN|nr:helix-turn-helix domain-containing protein [Streptomyces coffeae]MBL1100089.1 helix-turn-helix domain-containing protein [Streptomyces coffeae]
MESRRDWTRLGRAIRSAREELGMTQAALAKAAGVARQTLRSLEAGEDRGRIPPSLGKVESALGWPSGHAMRTLEGRDEPPAPPAQTRPPYEGMPLRVIKELTDGQVLDSEVVDLTKPGSSSRLVVVYMSDAPAAEMDPEQLRAEIEEWTRVQRAMRRIAENEPPNVNEA